MAEQTAGPVSDAEVPAYWKALGLPGLIDVHTHFMPASVQDAVWRYFDSAGPLVGRPWPVHYREAEQERVDRLRGLGVRAFSSLVYPHKPAMAAWLNAWAADFAARTPDCLHTATFFPEPGAPAYVEDALRGGARIFKAHVQVGGYDPRDRRLAPVWGLLADAAVPVVVHAGSGPVPGPWTGPGPFGEVLAEHPALTAIIAHLGMPEYAGFTALAARHPNVYLDTTMVFVDFFPELLPAPAEIVARLRDLAPRVLLGTDFPNIPYPFAHQLEALARLGLGDDWMRAVCWGNAAGLFAIS